MNARRTCKVVGSASTLFLLFAVFPVLLPAVTPVPTHRQLTTTASWAAAREGRVAWAVIDSQGRIHGRGATRLYPAASVAKALLLVAALRAVGDRPVPPDLAAQLDPMIRVSRNRAADAVYRRLGGDGALRDVARAARLRRVVPVGRWSNLRIGAGDVARFFLVADRIVPPRHRDGVRRLLERIDHRQSWGMPHALRGRGWRVHFKGGWRGPLVLQGALAERDGRRVAIAVLTDDNPWHGYGRGTIEGIARRLLTSAGTE